MSELALPPPHGLARWLRAIPAAGAWFFALATLLPLTMMLYSLWPPGSTEHSHIFSSEIEGVSYRGFGMEYQGTAGLALAAAQAAAVVAGLVLSALPGALARRSGHAILVGWGCLWLGNAISFAVIDESMRGLWLGVAAAIAPFFACTVSWAVRRW